MKLWNKHRLIIQLAIIGIVIFAVVQSADPEAFCPFGGVLSIGSRYVNGASSCQMGETQMFLGVGLLIGILVMGKLFCSHICPIGTVTEWLGRWGRKLKIQIKQIPKLLDRSLRSLKYLLLFPVLYYTATSSELFCKTFDPYFAATTGFGADVELWWAIAAVAVTIIGSVFVRQFWCKYFCPLGALSNIFMTPLVGVGALVIYLALRFAGLEISIVWLFIAWLGGGLIIELLSRKSYFGPLLKISRNTETCTNCKICDKACPYSIEVSQMERIDHVDCTMCTDCVDSCPVEDTLTIRKRNWRLMPSFATGLIVVLSLGFSSKYELSTVSEKWNIETAGLDLSKYQSTIKSVKCYGSAMSLMRRIRNEEGIHGMDAYAKSHKVVIYYDDQKIDLNGVKKSLFSSYKSEVRTLPKENPPEELGVAFLGVMNLNDNVDNYNMIRALQQSKYIYGMETFFGEPVRMLVYYHPEEIMPEELIELVEAERITYKVRGEEKTADLNFEVETSPVKIGMVNSKSYLSHIFQGYNRSFNEYESREPENLAILEIDCPDVKHPMKRRYLPYFVSHISNDEGIVRMETAYTGLPVARFYFDPAKTDTAKIMEIISMPKMQVTFSSGETREYDNPFNLKNASRLRKVAETEQEKEQLAAELIYLETYRDQL